MFTTLVLKLLLPLLLQELVKSGAMTEFQATAITSIKDLAIWIKSLKTYSEPTDFPQQKSNFT